MPGRSESDLLVLGREGRRVDLDGERLAIPDQGVEHDVNVAPLWITARPRDEASLREVSGREYPRGEAHGGGVEGLARLGLDAPLEAHERELGRVVLPGEDRERCRAAEERELLELAGHALGLARGSVGLGEEPGEGRGREEPREEAGIARAG